MKIRREKGLRYNYDDKYSPDHKCKPKIFLLIGDEKEQYSFIIEEVGAKGDATEIFISVIPEVSMHALAGQISPRTIRVKGQIGNHYVHVLIDSGNAHNFIQERVVQQLGLPIAPSKHFKVYIGNRNFLICDSSCLEVKLCFPGINFAWIYSFYLFKVLM